MIKLERSVEIGASQEEAFAYVSDLRTAASWDPGTSAVEQIEGDGPGPGARYLRTSAFRTKDVRTPHKTVTFEPPQLVVFEGGTRRFSVIETIGLAPGSEGTTLTYSAEYNLRGIFRFAEPFYISRLEIAANEAVDGLHAALNRFS